MRWRGAKVLTSTWAARTAVSSSSRRAKRGTWRRISGLQGMGFLRRWEKHREDCISGEGRQAGAGKVHDHANGKNALPGNTYWIMRYILNLCPPPFKRGWMRPRERP